MNFKKLYLAAAILLLEQQIVPDSKKITLKCPALRLADDAGIFHAPMIDILQSRIDFMKLIQGEKEWSGVVINIDIYGLNQTISIHCKRPEILYGASFIVLSPDHELAQTITSEKQYNLVSKFITSKLGQSLYDRQINANHDIIETGAYGIHPLTKQLLPIYISDYAIECFDMRHSKARIAVPAHNSKDLEIARLYNLPIKLVVNVQHNLQGKKDDLGPVVAAPLLDKQGNLTEAYLGEYAQCIIVNSENLTNLSLKEAAHQVIHYLEKNNLGCSYKKVLKYTYNNQLYAIKDLAKLEAILYKNENQLGHQVQALKAELQIALNYIQADFLDLAEKFLINIKNTKSLMAVLIEEDCQLRNNNDCYLLKWAQLKGNFNEKEAFRRDITSIKNFCLFCKDLVFFLEDFAHSCPKAIANIRNQNN